MKILAEQKLLPELTKVSLPFCEHCVTSKQHKLKFSTSNYRSKVMKELVHSDVWQAPVSSLRGAKYFVSFIDDYSRRCWVYPITRGRQMLISLTGKEDHRADETARIRKRGMRS